VEVGMKECQNQSVFVGRRDKTYKERVSQNKDEFVATLTRELDVIHTTLLTRARTYLTANTLEIHTEKEFYDFFKDNNAGFALAHWNGDAALEAKIKQDLNVTIRCIPLTDGKPLAGKCIFSGENSAQAVIFAKSY
jgi:prolyl-tRNA synthetase